jgi:hypothetical protein
VLKNSARGGQLSRDVTRAALKAYLGLAVEDPPPLPAPPADAGQVAGRYTRPFADLVVTGEGDRLMIQTIQKQGFPTPATPVPPPAPATPFAFYGTDRLIGLEGLTRGARAEILRLPDGSIGWIRLGSRLHRRVGDPQS